MGKYTLESFEKYKVLRMRPDENESAAHAPGSRAFLTVRVSPGEEVPMLYGKALLIISVPDVPKDKMAETECSIRTLVSSFYCNKNVLGVMVESGMDEIKKRRLWETAALAFAPGRYYVPVNDSAQMDYMLKHGMARGLYVPVGENVYDVCEAFAENNAQQLFKQMPVLVSFAKDGEVLAKYAEGWHAQAVENTSANAGWCIALRRLMSPSKITSGGFMPLRFWWTNRGPAYCHEKTRVCLRLVSKEVSESFELYDQSDCIHLADRVHNEIVRVPRVTPGTYRLEFGIFTEAGEALMLAHDNRSDDGFYFAGEIAVDDLPRPELEHIWDNYSPDGYYPLEDPKVPG